MGSGLLHTRWERPDGRVTVEELPENRRQLFVEPSDPRTFIARNGWTTRYPLWLIEAILDTKGLSHLCDEIMREEDPAYVEHHMDYDVLSYVAPEAFAGKRVLDFGCGSGASTMVLRRKLPGARIVALELEERLLSIAKLRARHYGVNDIEFVHSPEGASLPAGLGRFDFVLFSAVFEHLFPAERSSLLPLLWDHLEPGGILFLNQTPHRYSFVESHTTDLPFINYLPDSAALWAARRFSKRVTPDQTWEQLLRGGIRGGSVSEVLAILTARGQPPRLLQPTRQGMTDRIDLWLQASSARFAFAKRSLRWGLKALKAITGRELTLSLSLALQKGN